MMHLSMWVASKVAPDREREVCGAICAWTRNCLTLPVLVWIGKVQSKGAVVHELLLGCLKGFN